MQEGRKIFKITSDEIVAGHPVRARPNAANHCRPSWTAVRDVIIKGIWAENPVRYQAVNSGRFSRLQAVWPQAINANN